MSQPMSKPTVIYLTVGVVIMILLLGFIAGFYSTREQPDAVSTVEMRRQYHEVKVFLDSIRSGKLLIYVVRDTCVGGDTSLLVSEPKE